MPRKKPEPGVIPPPPSEPTSPCTVVNRLRLCLEPVEPCENFPILSSGAMVQAITHLQICDAVQEQIWVMCIDTQGYLRGFAMLVQGQVDEARISPADLLRVLVTYNVPRFIIVHNHPSGRPEPSSPDDALTSRLVEVTKLAGFVMLDHLILAGGAMSYFSYRDEGRMPS